MTAFNQMEDIEGASLDALRALQLQRLKAAVYRAYRVPYYKRSMRRPASIQTT